MSIDVTVNALQKQEDVKRMNKSIRAWAFWLLFTGVVSIFAYETLDPIWGAILIGVAVLSFRVKMPAMFIVYSTLMGWAAMSNFFIVTLGESKWLVFALIQMGLTFFTAREYRKYRLLQNQNDGKALRKFGIANTVISIACVILPLTSCLAVFTYIAVTTDPAMSTLTPQDEQLMADYITYVSGFFSLSALSLGLGMAALTAKENPRGWAIAGIVISSILLASMVLLSIIGTVIT